VRLHHGGNAAGALADSRRRHRRNKLCINLGDKIGTLFKSVLVVTDKGSQTLGLRVNLAPPVAPLTEAQRAAGIAAAKVDRQAVFKGDCATCHRRNVL